MVGDENDVSSVSSFSVFVFVPREMLRALMECCTQGDFFFPWGKPSCGYLNRIFGITAFACV